MNNIKQSIATVCFVFSLSLVPEISKAVPATDYGEAREEVLETIDIGLEETQNNDKEVKETLDKAEQVINDLMNNSIKTVDILIDTVTKGGNLSAEDKNALRKQTGDLKKQIEAVQNDAEITIDSIRKDYNANSKKVSDAYVVYRKAVDDYYDGKITKSELKEQGKAFKNIVSSAKTSKRAAAIDKLLKETVKISESAKTLKESIIEKLKGTGDYDDSNNQLLNKQRYAFNFHKEHTSAFLKGCYASKNTTKSCGLFKYSGGQDKFLLSRELTAKGTSTAKGSGDCLNLRNSIKDIEENPSAFMDDFRECVVRAKTESVYFCADARNEEELAECKPFSMEPNFKKKYKNNGILMHVWQDYSIANIAIANQIKQYAMTWLELDPSKKSESTTLQNLLEAFSNMDNTRNSYRFLQQFDIEMLRLWSELRRIDAVYRAKEAVDFYRQQQTLYLDGRDPDFEASEKENARSGLLKNKDPDCSGEEDCEIQDKNILSNGLLFLCGKELQQTQLKATDISIYYRNKGDSAKIEEAEKNIKECFYVYAEGATRGTINGSDTIDGAHQPDVIKKKWRKNETKALTDSLFHTLALATINLYKSAKDYATLDNDEINIASLAEETDSSTDGRGDYGAGAKMNYYGTMQLLSIVDADAQSLQTEIIRDLSKISYNFFEKQEDEGEN